MKIDYISDLHLDSHVKTSKEATHFISKLMGSGDILLFAGDLDESSDFLVPALSVFKSFYKNVVFIPGNHDLYGNTYNRLACLEDIAEYYGVTVLNYNTHNFGDITVGGGPCWCDFSYTGNRWEAFRKYPYEMKDLSHIDPRYFKHDAWKYADIVNDTFLRLEPKCDILVSHFGGKRESIEPYYKNDFSTNYFYWNGEQIKKPWVFGHQHGRYTNEKNIFVNPFGYPEENEYMPVQSFKL